MPELDMEDDQYIYPTTRGRMVFGAHIIIGLLFFIFFKFIAQSSDSMEYENATIEELQAYTDYLKSFTLTISIVSIIFCLGSTGYYIKKGNKTIKSNQFPPPGTSVPFKTKIVYGRYAKRRGIGCYLLVAVLLALTSIFVYLIVLLYQ